jgi:hypothetical protein
VRLVFIKLVTVALKALRLIVFVVVAMRLLTIAVPVAVKLVPVAFANLKLLVLVLLALRLVVNTSVKYDEIDLNIVEKRLDEVAF